MPERCFSRQALKNAKVYVCTLEPGCPSPSLNERAWHPPVNLFHRDKRDVKQASKQTVNSCTPERLSPAPAADGKPLPCKNVEDLKPLTLKSETPVFQSVRKRLLGLAERGREGVARRQLIRRCVRGCAYPCAAVPQNPRPSDKIRALVLS